MTAVHRVNRYAAGPPRFLLWAYEVHRPPAVDRPGTNPVTPE